MVIPNDLQNIKNEILNTAVCLLWLSFKTPPGPILSIHQIVLWGNTYGSGVNLAPPVAKEASH